MEFSLISKQNICDDAIMSIRAGSVRRQAALKSERKFNFPAIDVLKENPVRVDIMKHVGTAFLCLKPEGGQYKLEFDGETPMASCELCVQMGDGSESEKPSPSADRGTQGTSAKDAKTYLDSHKVLEIFQSILQTVLKEKPSDPCTYIGKQFMNGYTPTDCPQDRQTSQEKHDLPKEDDSMIAQLTSMGFGEAEALVALRRAREVQGACAVEESLVTAAIDLLTNSDSNAAPATEEHKKGEEEDEEEAEEHMHEEGEEEEEEHAQDPEEDAEVSEEEGENPSPESWPGRLKRLALHVASTEVKVHEAEALEEIPAKLRAEEVGDVFLKYVPGVADFLYRGQDGQHSLEFVKSAYANGLRAYQDTALHTHFLWLLRLIVHYGHEGNSDAHLHLRPVAESFMDCQAVQARVIESVGLKLRGLRSDFRSLLTSLISEYKFMAIRSLTYQICMEEGGIDDGTRDPAHLENRLIIDIGAKVGFSDADLRRAGLDMHTDRWPKAEDKKVRTLVKRFHKLFDVEDVLKAMVSELSSFNDASGPESMPRMFLQWASEWMTQQFVLMDEDTCSRIDVEPALGLAVLEVVFFGRPGCAAEETYREEVLHSLFKTHVQPDVPSTDNAEEDASKNVRQASKALADHAEASGNVRKASKALAEHVEASGNVRKASKALAEHAEKLAEGAATGEAKTDE
eukprot:TRINITY_DN25956_c0_g1_i1.p1 TRINITY_DN25956_c0_g1~~TRINITY_DN25956_c0_g1_i1.p1  ORF type:complete len:685 (-),score=139.18 TRINITY_DN25956_c0_g1_i1:91-2145(-)